MVLYGASGSGKSTLLVDLERRLTEAGVACAHAATTHSLDDITRALEQVFPAENTLDVPQRMARPRAMRFANLQGGVLLLDHLTDVNNLMVRLLHRLRGVIGVLTAVDTEVEQERHRMKPWRLAALSMRMPPFPAALLRELLHARCAKLHVSLPGPDAEQQLLRAANGRPGWILQCVDLQAQGHYRQGEQIFVAELSDDTENALRHLALGMKPSDEAFS
jgi:hypothetical protein